MRRLNRPYSRLFKGILLCALDTPLTVARTVAGVRKAAILAA